MMEPGLRQHRSASLRVAIPEGLPVRLHDRTRELLAVRSEDQGNGDATGLLCMVCHEADKAGLALLVQVDPFDEGLEKGELQRWYASHGFERIQREPLLMARGPRQ